MFRESDIKLSQEEQIVIFRKLLRQLAMQMFEHTGFDDEYIDIVVKYDKCKNELLETMNEEQKALFEDYNELIKERQRYLLPIVYEMYDMYDFKYRNVEKFSVQLSDSDE